VYERKVIFSSLIIPKMDSRDMGLAPIKSKEPIHASLEREFKIQRNEGILQKICKQLNNRVVTPDKV
jgi:hypothetical protein